VDIYSLKDMKLVTRYLHQNKENILVQVASACDDQWAVVGGDDGSTQVFDVQSGKFLHKLECPKSRRLQTVAVSFVTTNQFPCS
jgi:hypothetical protein